MESRDKSLLHKKGNARHEERYGLIAVGRPKKGKEKGTLAGVPDSWMTYVPTNSTKTIISNGGTYVNENMRKVRIK